MFEVIDIFKIGSNLSVTLKGKCDGLKNGTVLRDSEGHKYNVLSVAMTRHDDPAEFLANTTALIAPCKLQKGAKLYL